MSLFGFAKPKPKPQNPKAPKGGSKGGNTGGGRKQGKPPK